MLRSAKDLENYVIGATDGDIGHVKDFYFDDEDWVIRYLVVNTGSWLFNRNVLVSPISIRQPIWSEQKLFVSITKDQVKNSPNIDTDKPVSRQMEMQYFGHYRYPYYWDGAGMWGEGLYPYAMVPGYAVNSGDRVESERELKEYARVRRERHRNDDPHLRSYKAIGGYHIHATDGDIGHVEDLILDEKTWAIRYFVVNTSNWWVGHKVLISPQWITGLQWLDRSASVGLTRESVRGAPPYDSTAELNRQHESDLYGYYRRTQYWVTDAELESAN